MMGRSPGASSAAAEHAAASHHAAEPPPTVTLKMTLKECELVFVERPDDVESFACVARTTAVLVANNVGLPERTDAQLELQVSDFWVFNF